MTTTCDRHYFDAIFQKRKLQRVSDVSKFSKLVNNRTRIYTLVAFTHNLTNSINQMSLFPFHRWGNDVICPTIAWLLCVRAGIQTSSTWLLQSYHDSKRRGIPSLSGSSGWGPYSFFFFFSSFSLKFKCQSKCSELCQLLTGLCWQRGRIQGRPLGCYGKYGRGTRTLKLRIFSMWPP